jgi:hypothetical protein
LDKIANHFKVNIKVYKILKESTYQAMTLERESTFNKGYLFKHSILRSQNKFALLLPNAKKKFPTLSQYNCLTCCKWLSYDTLPEFKRNHQKTCKICICGRAFKEGDPHPILCQSLHKRYNNSMSKIKDPSECRLHTPAVTTEPNYKHHNHHADLECFPEVNGKFTSYSSCLYNSNTKDFFLECGPNSFEHFMKEILKLEGILWFFCGSRFDVYFILEYCILKGITIDLKNTMLTGSQVRILGLKTCNGTKSLLIKDLGFFLPGSLAFNCKGLGVKQDLSKTEFDHGKIKNWEDVETHKGEHIPYLKLDVIAQKECFEIASQQIWDDYHIDMCKFVSLAELAYAAFTIYVKPDLLYKIPIEQDGVQMEKHLREAYRGGRLVLTWPVWKSKQLESILTNVTNQSYLKKTYYEIKDYLLYLDKNSLYPWVMYKHKYPCGKCNYFLVDNPSQEKIIKKINNSKDKEDNTWQYRLLEVKITPPTDIYIGFIMDRNEKGSNTQDLKPKERIWLTGIEVIEAIKIGYTLNYVYAYYEWEKIENIFQEFVKVANDRKSNAEKGSAQYLIAKNIMNSSSGKHGQIGRPSKTALLIGEDITMEGLSKSDSRGIWNEEDELLAVFTEQDQPLTHTPYPLQLSVFILGNSRVCMSEFTRSIDGYRNPKNVPTYGDTDSLVVRKKSTLHLDPSEFGPKLGQMKDEIPNGKILATITLAPKTNMKLILMEEFNKETKEMNYSIQTTLTSKGVPHMREPYEYFKSYLVPTEKAIEAINIATFLEAREDTKVHYHHVTLKEPLYIRTEYSTNLKEVKDRIIWGDMEMVMNEQANIVCLYGGMIRNLKMDAQMDGIGISLDYMRRSLSNELWWKKGNRILTDKFPNEITKPLFFK